MRWSSFSCGGFVRCASAAFGKLPQTNVTTIKSATAGRISRLDKWDLRFEWVIVSPMGSNRLFLNKSGWFVRPAFRRPTRAGGFINSRSVLQPCLFTNGGFKGLTHGSWKTNRTAVPRGIYRTHCEEEIILGHSLHRVARNLA